MRRFSRIIMIGFVVMSLAITLSGLRAAAQNKDEEVVIDGRHVALKDIGRKDTIKIVDGDEEMFKIMSLLSPVSIDNKDISVEHAPYRLGSIVQKRIVEALCNGKYLKSLPGGTPTPDGYFCLGLTDIVVAADGTVAYYNFYSPNFYVEEDRVTRSVDLKSEVDKVVRQSCKMTKFNFKGAWLLLHVDISKIKFSVHQGVVKAN